MPPPSWSDFKLQVLNWAFNILQFEWVRVCDLHMDVMQFHVWRDLIHGVRCQVGETLLKTMDETYFVQYIYA